MDKVSSRIFPDTGFSQAKLLYWVYSALNKKFGSEIKISRDSLHATYAVNKYGVHIATNTMALNLAIDWLRLSLIEAGFEEELLAGSSLFCKRSIEGNVWGYYFSKQHDHLYVSSFNYAKRSKQ